MMTSEQTRERLKRDREMAALLLLLEESDVEAAWNRLAPRSFRGLLGARAASVYAPPAGQFWFNPEQARFGFGTRGYVPDTAVRQAVNHFNQRHGQELAGLALATVEVDEQPAALSTAQWEQAMERGIKIAQTANAAAGRGGLAQLEEPDIQAVAKVVQYQQGRLGLFTTQIEDGDVKRDAAARRAAAYALSGVTLYDISRRQAHVIASFTEERNILGIAEHCFARPGEREVDCPSMTKLGWIPMGGLVPVGLRKCKWNCRCHVVYRRTFR